MKPPSAKLSNAGAENHLVLFRDHGSQLLLAPLLVLLHLPRPKKPYLPQRKFTAAFAPPVSKLSPGKRSTTAAGIPDGRSSPAKKVTGPEKLTAGFSHKNNPQPLTVPGKPSPKKAPSLQAQQGAQPGGGLAKRASVGLRRPSGYFAQRKSLAGSNIPPPLGESSQQPALVSEDRTTQGLAGAAGAAGASELVEPVQESHITAAQDIDEPARHTPSPEAFPPKSLSDVTQGSDVAEEDMETEQDAIQTNGMSINSTAQSQDDSQQESSSEVEEGPQIFIEQFFEMTGIRFMDEIAAPRRSIAYPFALRPSRRTSNEAQIPLAEYIVAMAIDVPQLELYTHVSKDLHAWIERIQGIFLEAEEEVLKMTLQLFQEFVSMDETEQAEPIHQLKLIKVHNHELVKSEVGMVRLEDEVGRTVVSES